MRKFPKSFENQIFFGNAMPSRSTWPGVFEDVSCRIHDFLGEMHHATKNTVIHAPLKLFGLQNNLPSSME
jgi:hypothetical protein